MNDEQPRKRTRHELPLVIALVVVLIGIAAVAQLTSDPEEAPPRASAPTPRPEPVAKEPLTASTSIPTRPATPETTEPDPTRYTWIPEFFEEVEYQSETELVEEHLYDLSKAKHASALRYDLRKLHPNATMKTKVYNGGYSSLVLLKTNGTKFLMVTEKNRSDGERSVETFCSGKLCGTVVPEDGGFALGKSDYPDDAESWWDLPGSVRKQLSRF